ncbi:DUF998 domain-containing protein [Marinirhabdus gelatinilytica]|uniref:Uncharacterized protein DUF998 n=1 Tax=Marinirhabdus gelatinilytica TaxID=1703343 RepID=A0A370Q5A8_9FLAO|nr:DUF998 domain-containing protein [Marinirhabdus gelatinilytica]RDK83538.1 uncharacterized protein DUF998 [Marinirhabdus gelatinilytica]
MTISEKKVGIFGLLSVLTLLMSLLIFGFLNTEFSFLDDFISKLGAKNEPNAVWFNLIGFVAVGILLFIFGLAYGSLINDKLLSILLSLFGLGFAFTAIPIDMEFSDTPFSKAHIVAICLGLAFWLFGLSRLGYNRKLKRKVRNRANLTAVILVLSMIGFVFGVWSMPITHRLVFGIVFGWTAITSIELILKNETNRKTAHN